MGPNMRLASSIARKSKSPRMIRNNVKLLKYKNKNYFKLSEHYILEKAKGIFFIGVHIKYINLHAVHVSTEIFHLRTEDQVTPLSVRQENNKKHDSKSSYVFCTSGQG